MSLSKEAAMVGQHASILNDTDALLPQPRGDFVVTYAELEPDPARQRMETEDLVEMLR